MGRGLVLYRPAEIGPQLVRAAQYIRMSREHQRYSPTNQKQAIGEYAASKGFMVVRTYADHGKSGLNLRDRKGLIELLDDVARGNVDYRAILVLDVSRWGRFQDTDESATYEYLCRKAGVQVIYCAEPFPTDTGPLSSIMKAVKRSMAGEFSRDLSAKVCRGKRANAARGFFCGGAPAYGLRRQLVDERGTGQSVLSVGQHKVLSTQKVILVPGPPEEVETVRRIFRLYVHEKLSWTSIAELLNEEGVKTSRGNAWRGESMKVILRNERYVGANVYGQTSSRLKGPVTVTDKSTWIRKERAFEPILPRELFEAAQQRLAQRTINLSRAEMLDRLRDLWRRHGYLTAGLIESAKDTPGRKPYINRFGTVAKAFELIGYPISRFIRAGETTHKNLELRAEAKRLIMDRLRGLEFQVSLETPDKILVDNTIRVGIRIAHKASDAPLRWTMTRKRGYQADLTVVLCADAHGKAQRCYLLGTLLTAKDLRLGIPERLEVERFGCDTLSPFFDIAQAAKLSGRPFMACFKEWQGQLRRKGQRASTRQ